eukprot:Lankesteria_metandrocarpae@DN101_c0_g1_i1.p1
MSKFEYLKSYGKGSGGDTRSVSSRGDPKLQKYTKSREKSGAPTGGTSFGLSIRVDDDIPTAVANAASRRAMRGAGIAGLDSDMALMNELEGSSDEERREEVSALWRGVAQGGDTISLEDEEMLRDYLEQRKAARNKSSGVQTIPSRTRRVKHEASYQQTATTSLLSEQPQYDNDGDIDVDFIRRSTKSKYSRTADSSGNANTRRSGDAAAGDDPHDRDGYTNIKKRIRGMRSDEVDGVYGRNDGSSSSCNTSSSVLRDTAVNGSVNSNNKNETVAEHSSKSRNSSRPEMEAEVDSDGDIVVHRQPPARARRAAVTCDAHHRRERKRSSSRHSDESLSHFSDKPSVDIDVHVNDKTQLPPSMKFVKDGLPVHSIHNNVAGSGSTAGKAAAVVYRDSEGNEITREDWMDLQMKKDAARGRRRARPPRLAEPQSLEWEGGLVQKQERDARKEEDSRVAAAPVSRYEIDDDYDRQLRGQHYWDDPMREYVEADPPAASTTADDEGAIKSKKAKCRFVTPINRFGITAGYRWDGVVRGTDYEARAMQAKNTRELEKGEEYMWTVEDI